MGQSTRLYTAGKGGAVSGSVPPGLVPASTGATNNASLPATQSITGTSETVIADPAIQGGGTALILSIPPGGPCEQEPFEISASGIVNTGASSTVTIKLYSGTSLTPGSNTLLKSSGAITAFTGKSNWWIKARLLYDTTSGELNGTVQFMVNNNLVAEAAVTNVVTGISNTANPVASFVVSVQFGTGNANTTFTIHDFGVNH